MDNGIELLIRLYISNLEIFYNKQGSVRALTDRRSTIGCSELHEATHTESSKRGLIKKKLRADSNISTIIPIVWGHAFEPTTKLITSIILNCNIYDAPASIRSKNNINSCSPDGIGQILLDLKLFKKLVMNTATAKQLETHRGNYKFDNIVDFESPHIFYERFRKLNNGLLTDREKDLINKFYTPTVALFEFKSPYSRDLKGKINQEYVYQVLGGLEIINICDVGVFSECRFVICSKSQFAFDDKYLDFKRGTPDDSGLFMLKVPFFIGIKLFILNEELLSEMPYDDLVEIESTMDLCDIINKFTINRDYNVIDYCFIRNDEYSSRRLRDDFVTNISEILGIEIGDIVDRMTTDELINYLYKNHNRVFAVMHWKMMDIGVAYVNKITGFIDEHMDNISDVYNCINALKGLNSENIELVLSSLPPSKRNCRVSSIYPNIKSLLAE